MTIFLAGHETTANALTWTWYLLSQNPDVEQKLHEEIDRVLAGRVPAYEDVAELKFTEMVLAESMRLYPPAWATGRLAIVETEIARLHSAAQSVGADEPVRHAPRSALFSGAAAV